MFIFDAYLHFFSYDFLAALARQKDVQAKVGQTLAALGVELNKLFISYRANVIPQR